MKKKILAILLAGSMILNSSVYAMAEEFICEEQSLFSAEDAVSQENEPALSENNVTENTEEFTFSDGDVVSSETDGSDIIASGECGETSFWKITADGTLTVSGTGSVEYFFFKHPEQDGLSGQVKNIVVENGITSIGSPDYSPLRQFQNMTSLAIPGSVKKIEQGAFSMQNNLQNVTLSEGTTSIESDAFYFCTKLDNLTIPGSVKNIGVGAFSNCSSLSNLTLSNGINSIGRYAFFNCEKLNNITIPGSVKNIGEFAFEFCSSLIDLTLSDGILSLGDFSFGDCKNLSNITIPASMTSISKSTFWGSNINRLIIDSQNSVYDSRDNCNAIIETSTNTLIWGCSNATIPGSVSTIGISAFYNNRIFQEITIPEGVTCIEKRAFFNCKNLKEITIPKSVSRIEDYSLGYYGDEKNNYKTKNFTINCYPESAGYKYAVKHGFAYKFAAHTHAWDSRNICTYCGEYQTLSTPVLSKAVNVTGGVKVTWKAVKDAQKYRVYRKTSKSGWKAIGDASTNSYTDQTAVSGTTYVYTVRCLSADGKELISSYNNTGLTVTALSAPALKLSRITNGAKVSWNKIAKASGYQIKYSGNSVTKTKSISSASTISQNVTGLKSGKKYTFYIRSFKTVNGTKHFSAWSPAKSVTVK